MICNKNYISGKITLDRKDAQYRIGYGLIKNELPKLMPCINMLHPYEKEYLENVRYNARKQSYLLGRIAAKKALLELTTEVPDSIWIDKGVFNFPVVKNVYHQDNLQVSISHCNDIGVALAFTENHPLAIDIEYINVNQCQFIKKNLTSKELMMITDLKLDKPYGFVLLWSIKESLSKIFKTGMTMDFKLLEISNLTYNGGFYENSFVYCRQYKSISKIVNNYVVSIALPRNSFGIDSPYNDSSIFDDFSNIISCNSVFLSRNIS